MNDNEKLDQAMINLAQASLLLRRLARTTSRNDGDRIMSLSQNVSAIIPVIERLKHREERRRFHEGIEFVQELRRVKRLREQ